MRGLWEMGMQRVGLDDGLDGDDSPRQFFHLSKLFPVMRDVAEKGVWRKRLAGCRIG